MKLKYVRIFFFYCTTITDGTEVNERWWCIMINLHSLDLVMFTIVNARDYLLKWITSQTISDLAGNYSRHDHTAHTHKRAFEEGDKWKWQNSFRNSLNILHFLRCLKQNKHSSPSGAGWRMNFIVFFFYCRRGDECPIFIWWMISSAVVQCLGTG